MESLLLQLKLNSVGQNSYDFEKDLKGNPPAVPPQFKCNGASLMVPRMEEGVEKVEALFGVDVENILIDKTIGLYNYFKKEGVNPIVLENIMKSEVLKKNLLVELTKKMRDFYKKLNNQYLTPEQKQEAINKQLSNFRNYPAPFVREADRIAEAIPSDDEIESVVETVDLRGFFPDLEEEEGREELLREAEVDIPETSEDIERALVAGGGYSGTSGGGLESIVASDEGAGLPTPGLRTDTYETGRPEPRPESELEDLTNRLRFQQSRLVFSRDPDDREEIVESIQRLRRQIEFLRSEGAEFQTQSRRRRRPRRDLPPEGTVPLTETGIISRRNMFEQLMEESGIGEEPED